MIVNVSLFYVRAQKIIGGKRVEIVLPREEAENLTLKQLEEELEKAARELPIFLLEIGG